MALLSDIYQQANRPVDRRTKRRLFGGLAVFVVAVVGFVAIAEAVIDGETAHFDTSALLHINHHATPTLDHVMVAVTTAGDALTIVMIGVAVSLYLAYRRRWRALAQIVAGTGGAAVLNVILKLLFERNRPLLWTRLVSESGYSFPSGHAMLSSALALSVIVIVWHTRWRWVALVLGGLYVAAVGFSRLYLGVHYPTDILAGWIVSLALVAVVTAVIGGLQTPDWLARALRRLPLK